MAARERREAAEVRKAVRYAITGLHRIDCANVSMAVWSLTAPTFVSGNAFIQRGKRMPTQLKSCSYANDG